MTLPTTKEMTNSPLAKCPCGATPTLLSITDTGQGGKYLDVQGNCCGKWKIEFRNNYNYFSASEKLAEQSWNSAPIPPTVTPSQQEALDAAERLLNFAPEFEGGDEFSILESFILARPEVTK